MPNHEASNSPSGTDKGDFLLVTLRETGQALPFDQRNYFTSRKEISPMHKVARLLATLLVLGLPVFAQAHESCTSHAHAFEIAPADVVVPAVPVVISSPDTQDVITGEQGSVTAKHEEPVILTRPVEMKHLRLIHHPNATNSKPTWWVKRVRMVDCSHALVLG